MKENDTLPPVEQTGLQEESQPTLLDEVSSTREKLLDMKRGRGRPRKVIKELSLDDLLTRVKELEDQNISYKNLLGNLRTPIPSRTVVDHTSFFNGKLIRFGVTSDMHFGSKLSRPDDLQTTYDLFQKEGIKDVYVPGDITDGSYTMHPGMIYEQKFHTLDEQIDDVVENYPRRKGIRTHFILGNHDYSWIKLAGVDIGLMIARQREDMDYIGQIETDVEVTKGIKMRLRHPSDGGSYALSYKLQRYMDSLQGGTKPNILLQGHYHVAYEMEYRNIFAIQVPAYQDQTIYLKQKGLQPSCGAYIVEAHIKDDSINRFKTERVKFY